MWFHWVKLNQPEWEQVGHQQLRLLSIQPLQSTFEIYLWPYIDLIFFNQEMSLIRIPTTLIRSNHSKATNIANEIQKSCNYEG